MMVVLLPGSTNRSGERDWANPFAALEILSVISRKIGFIQANFEERQATYHFKIFHLQNL